VHQLVIKGLSVGLVISQTPCYRIGKVKVQHRRDHIMYAFLHNDTNGGFSNFTNTL